MTRKYRKKTDRTYRNSKPADVPQRYEPGFLSKLDGRTEIARQLREHYNAIVDDLGGPSELSHVKHALVERFTFLEAVLGGIESQIAQAQTSGVDPVEARRIVAELTGRWVQAVNSLQGLARALGMERRPRTVDLKTYIASASEKEGDE